MARGVATLLSVAFETVNSMAGSLAKGAPSPPLAFDRKGSSFC